MRDEATRKRQMAELLEDQHAFDAMRGKLMAEGHEGKTVLFKNGVVLDYFETETAAYREGLRRFGTENIFLIDRVEKKRIIFILTSHQHQEMAGAT